MKDLKSVKNQGRVDKFGVDLDDYDSEDEDDDYDDEDDIEAKYTKN